MDNVKKHTSSYLLLCLHTFYRFPGFSSYNIRYKQLHESCVHAKPFYVVEIGMMVQKYFPGSWIANCQWIIGLLHV